MFFENCIYGAITTEPEQVVNHGRKLDATTCPVKAGRSQPKMAFYYFRFHQIKV
jgi:hypothetical protein